MIDWDAFWRRMDAEIAKLPHRRMTRREQAVAVATLGAMMGMAQTRQYGVPEKPIEAVLADPDVQRVMEWAVEE